MNPLLELKGLTTKVITRQEATYESARTMWNRAIEKYPLAIVYCQNKEDIKHSIKWAKTHNIPIRIRSGRHHYEGYSTGNDVLVIDMSEMTEIKINETNQTVTIQGGVRNRELYEALGAKGYPFPGGGCPTVGVVGFALGGGWGYSGRLLGLCCDRVTEIELINHEGECIIASEKEYSDLFWALKGSGGGQFGVVVSMTFRLPEKRSEATLLRLEYAGVIREEQIQMWQLWQEQIKKLPMTVNFKLSFYHSKEKGMGMLLIGIYYGTTEEAYEILAPFIQLGGKLQVMVQSMSVLEVNRWIQNAHPDYEHYKSSGRFVKEKFSKDQIDTLLNSINERAEGAIYTALSCYGMGGKMLDEPGCGAAFNHRDSLYILGFQSVWEDNQYSLANRNWFTQHFDTIRKMTQGSFVNFPAKEVQNYRAAYYGKHSKLLVEIREKYDPNKVFTFEQGL